MRSLAELDNNQGFLGDFVDATQKGASDALGGIAHTFGLEGLEQWSADMSQRQLDQMSLSGRNALAAPLVERDEMGNLILGEGATPESIALQIGHVIGANFDVVLGGGAMKAGRAALTAVRNRTRDHLIAKGLAKPAATKAGEGAAQEYAKKKFSDDVINFGVPAHAAYGGMQAQDIQAEVEAMDYDEILQTEDGQARYQQLKDAYPTLGDEQLLPKMRQLVAEDAGNSALTNSTLITANMLFGGMQAKVLDTLLRGGMGKGAALVAETGLEGAQEAMEQVAHNQTMQNYKPDTQIGDGVAEAAISGAVIGGGMAGAGAGVRTVLEKGLGLPAHQPGAEQPAQSPAQEPIIPNTPEPAPQQPAQPAEQPGEVPEVAFMKSMRQQVPDIKVRMAELGIPDKAQDKVTAIVKNYQAKRLMKDNGQMDAALLNAVVNGKTYKRILKHVPEDQRGMMTERVTQALREAMGRAMPAQIETKPPENGTEQPINETNLAKNEDLPPQNENQSIELNGQQVDPETGEILQAAPSSLAQQREMARQQVINNSRSSWMKQPDLDKQVVLDAEANDPKGTYQALEQFNKSAQTVEDQERLEARIFEIAAMTDPSQSRLRGAVQAARGQTKFERKETVLSKRRHEDELTSAELAQQSVQKSKASQNPPPTGTELYMQAEQSRRQQAEAEAKQAEQLAKVEKIQNRKQTAAAVVDDIVETSQAERRAWHDENAQAASEQELEAQQARENDYDAALNQHQQNLDKERRRAELGQKQEGVHAGLDTMERRVNSARLQAMGKKLSEKRGRLLESLVESKVTSSHDALLNALYGNEKAAEKLQSDYVPNNVLADAYKKAKADGQDEKAQVLSRLEQAKAAELAKIRNKLKRREQEKRIDQALKNWLAEDDGDWSMPTVEPVTVGSPYEYQAPNYQNEQENSEQQTELTTENVDNILEAKKTLPGEPDSLPGSAESLPADAVSLPVEPETLPSDLPSEAGELPPKVENQPPKSENLTPETENITPQADELPGREPELVIEDYSDKSVVIRGNTQVHKDKLQQSGVARFNARLKGGPGWIVPKSKLNDIRAVVDQVNQVAQPQSENRALLEKVQSQNLTNIRNNNDLKRLAQEVDGLASTKEVTPLRLKQVQEAYETVSVKARRGKVNELLDNQGVEKAYSYAVEQYQNQPSLDVRTKASSDFMAYSTPTPMSLLANLAAGVDGQTSVYEPTAGNGLLLLTAAPGKVIANELNPTRADSLAWSGYQVTTQDAVAYKPKGKVDSVLANPPFGAYRDDTGKRARYEFTDPQGKVRAFGEIDHIIVKQSLDVMKDNGKATLIIGAPKQPGDYKANNKAFLNWLYNNYNVVHHVEAEGSLYKGQGAAWPVQMIVVHGRAKQNTGRYAPVKGDIKRVDNWNELYETFNELGLLDTQRSTIGHRQGAAQLLPGQGKQADSTQREAGPGNENSRSDRRAAQAGPGRTESATADARTGQRDTGADDTTAVRNRTTAQSGRLEETTGQPATNTDSTEADGPTERNDVSRTHTRRVDTKSLKIKKANAFQAQYIAASDGFNEGVLTPVNMASSTHLALAELKAKHGSIDKFIQDRLGYPDKGAVHKAFMGLQADAIALAIDNIEQGRAIIIGDQTGVGKGRQAAGVMRYAMQQGKIPVFVSQKPNLFTDMYDDLRDIGVPESRINPLIVNADGFISKEGQKLHQLNSKERTRLLDELSKQQAMPEDFGALFLTYSQISSDQSGAKSALLSSIAKNAIFVLDESHTAAGTDSKLGKVFQGLVNKAHGVTYLSATYAKRPDNMLLYTRTDLGLAAKNYEAMVNAVATGGLGMQTYIAGKLAEAGQMVRRERSFEGINIRNRTLEDPGNKVKTGFDEVTRALRAIQDLSAAWASYVKKDLAKQIARESGMDTQVAGNQADTKVNVALFSSVVHNYIAQLSLGLKAKHVGRLAIEAIEAGQRPVIALENTMGSALEHYMDSTGNSVGDSASGLSFATLLEKVADGVLAYSVREPGSRKSKKFQVSIESVDNGHIQYLYQQVQDVVKAMNVTDVPASPIDAIRHEITQAGYSVAEITGRDRYVDYGDNARIIAKPKHELDRRQVVDRFNSGDLDVLILNQAGSTGLSIHAKEGFKDTRQRRMIVAQPSLDINTFMQMLGRVNRTGQVIVPEYDLAWLPLPSEKRPAAVLAKKMASLNANTSGNTDSATSVDSSDMLNQYGDQLVKAFVRENHGRLHSYSPRLVDLPESDQASYFMGKLAVLPVDVQEEILEAVEQEYDSFIEYLNTTGQNDLDSKELDLDAKPVAILPLSEGRKGAGVFAESTYLVQVDAKAQGKAPDWQEVQDLLGEYDQQYFDKAIEAMQADTRYLQGLRTRADKLREQIANRKAKGQNKDTQESDLFTLEEQIAAYQSTEREYRNVFGPGGALSHGTPIRLKLEGQEKPIVGMVSGLRYTHKAGKGSPLSQTKWNVSVVTADRLGKISLTLKVLKDGALDSRYYAPEHQLAELFDRAAKAPSRETRHIMMGNLIEAQSRSEMKGRIIPFTTQDGSVLQGMVMPPGFSPEKNVKDAIDVTVSQMVDWLTKTQDEQLADWGLNTLDNMVSLSKQGGRYELSMPKAVSKGKRYWGDPRIEEIIGEQAVKGSGTLTVPIAKKDLVTVANALHAIGELELRQAQIADYRQLNAIQSEEFTETNSFEYDAKASDIPAALSDLGVSGGNGTVEPLSVVGARSVIDPIENRLMDKGRGTVIVERFADFSFPEALRDYLLNNGYDHAAGFLIDGKVYLNLEHIQSYEKVQEIYIHERLRHYGFRKIFGTRKYMLLKSIYDGLGKDKVWELAKKHGVDIEGYQRLYKGHHHPDAAIMDEVLAHIQPDDVPVTIWNRIKTLGTRLKLWFREKGFNIGLTEQDAFNVIAWASHAVKSKAPNPEMFDNGQPPAALGVSKIDASKSIYQAKEALRKFKLSDIPKAIKSAWENNRKYALALAPRRTITELASTLSAGSQSFVDSLKRYDALVSKMEASRNEMINRAQEVADGWRKLMASNSKAADDMASLMHDATLSGVDPSTETYVPAIGIQQAEEMLSMINTRVKMRNGDTTFIAQQMQAKQRIEAALKKEKDGSREADYERLRERYLALPDGFKGHFVKREQGRTYDKTLKRKGLKIWQPGVFEQARDVYRAQNIRREQAIVDRIQELLKDEKAAKALATEIRFEFEMNEVEGVYFPLSRFGEYVGMVLDEQGNLVSHSMFEGYGQLKAWQEQQQAEYADQDYTILAEKRVDMSRQLDAVSPKFMNNVVERLKGFGTRGDEIRDEIYQLYLESLPEMSARKQQIHRKGIVGYSKDALRAYAHNTFHGAYNVARIENTHHMDTVLEELRLDQKTARDNGNDESFKMTDIINEFQRRHDWILNPQGGALANTLTNLGFMWYLGATPAAALLNMTQTPILALPIMGAKYGWATASKELARASMEFVKGKGHAEKGLKGYEKLAFEHFLDSGVIDKTLAHDLSGLAEGGVEYSPRMHKFTEMVSFMFHHTERFNRETTALAAYRMATKRLSRTMRDPKEVHEKALAEATEITYKAHFDYSNANKARFMQSDPAKVLLLFRQHSLNMTWRLIRDVQQAVKGRTKAQRTEARKQLAGILGMTFMFAGAVGMPLFSSVMGLLNLAFDDEDEPFDAEAQLRAFVSEELGPEASALLFKGAFNMATGADVSSRTSLNNLWMRDPDPNLEGEAVVQYYAEQALGPIFGIALGFGRATELWRQGHIDRAAEAALPKALRDGLKALRYHQEGVNSYRGDAVIEDTTPWQEVLQATGWTPHEVSDVYGQNRALKGYERQLKRRRKLLLNRYALGVRLGDQDMIKTVNADIERFNERNPAIKITPKQRAQSVRRRKEISREATNGIILDKKLAQNAQQLSYLN
ncbi:PLxRFG domain-containing protein [Pseudoalteromonas rubra]|uniref:PLxRFG domain-containing protein n=1 Tax=Pseudoalteromonas rubra TaxID=43658 RepID=UPI002DBD5805|nr:PLxRFG domain-containing protein [Pseudoalteromonas rubra]MEC4091630.1 PLxRFG domain-containing protein [Pseudoalteromonas rubra]